MGVEWKQIWWRSGPGELARGGEDCAGMTSSGRKICVRDIGDEKTDDRQTIWNSLCAFRKA